MPSGDVIATAWVEIIPEMSGSRSKIADDLGDQLDPEAEKAGKSAGEKASESFSSSFNSALGHGKTLVTGFAAIGAAITGLSAVTEPYVENMARLDGAFTSSGQSVEAARSSYSNFMGLLGDSDRAVEASQDMANLAEAGGNIDTWYNIASGAMARFGDALPTENLIESANETARTGLVVGSMADALNWAGASTDQWSNALSGHTAAQQAFNDALAQGLPIEDAMNAALATTSDTTERQAILQDALNGIYGDAGIAYQQNNSVLIESRQAQADFNQSLAELGTAVIPAMTALTSLATLLISGLMPYFPYISAGLVGIAAGFAAFQVASIVMNAVNAVKALSTATSLANAVQMVFNNTLRANPIVLIITLVMALVAALIYFFTQTELGQQIWATFMSWLQQAWTNIQIFFSSIWSAITGFFTNAATTAQNTWAAVSSFFNGLVNSILGFFSGIVSAIGGYFTNAANQAKNAWNTALSFFSGIGDRIRGFFSGAASWLVDAGKSIINGFLNGLKDTWNNVTGWLSGLGSQIVSLKGPPEYDAVLLTENGTLIMESLLVGLVGGYEDVEKYLSSRAVAISDSVGSASVRSGGFADGNPGEVSELLLALFKALPGIIRNNTPDELVIAERTFASLIRRYS